LEAVTDREMPGDHVDDGGRHEEGRDLARIVGLQVVAVLALDGPQTADAGAAYRATSCLVFLGEIDAGVADRLHTGGDAVVHEVVHAPGFFRLQVEADIEVAHGTAEAHRKSGDVEARHRSNPALPAQDGIPC